MTTNRYSNNRRNYYRLLHVQPDAPEEIIRASYRTLMQKLRHHPDLGGDDCNAALLNQAYTVLTNPGSRAKYDQQSGYNQNHRDAKQSEILASDTCSNEDQPLNASQNDDTEPVMVHRCIFCKLPLPTNPKLLPEPNCPHCQSPLKGITRPEFDTVCKRVLHRTDYHTPLEFFIKWPQASPYVGTIRDLSPVGLGFSSIHKLSVNQLLKVSCVGLLAIARVTYCKPDTFRYRFNSGIQFVTLQISQPQGRFVSEMV